MFVCLWFASKFKSCSPRERRPNPRLEAFYWNNRECGNTCKMHEKKMWRGGKCHNKMAEKHAHKHTLTQDKSQQKRRVGGSGEEAERRWRMLAMRKKRLLDARCRSVQAVAHYLTSWESMNGWLCHVNNPDEQGSEMREMSKSQDVSGSADWTWASL